MNKKDLVIGKQYVVKTSYGTPRNFNYGKSIATKPSQIERYKLVSTNLPQWLSQPHSHASATQIHRESDGWRTIGGRESDFAQANKSFVVFQVLDWDGTPKLDGEGNPMYVSSKTIMVLISWDDYKPLGEQGDINRAAANAAAAAHKESYDKMIAEFNAAVEAAGLTKASLKPESYWQHKDLSRVTVEVPIAHMVYILKQYGKMRVSLVAEGVAV